ncbi:MAG: MoxR family ATPase [Fimbriimonadales bacterium]
MSVEQSVERIQSEIGKAIVGQRRTIEHVLAGVLADGHILLEGVPGVAKTLIVRCLAKTLGLEFGRVQFTPDLMPSDVIGTNVFDQKTSDFVLRKGPIFVAVLLADEINRTPPKTQASLLEAMEERRATIDGVPHQLPFPFVVFATQNPIEFEGTYPLPEAQLDRFLMKVIVPYPEEADEAAVLQRYAEGFRAQELDKVGIQQVVDAAGLVELRKQVNAVRVEPDILGYINHMVRLTRTADMIAVGGSPRASIAILLCSKAIAAIRGREFVIPDDVKEVALPVLRHRVLLRPEAEIEGITPDQVVLGLFESVPVPR